MSNISQFRLRTPKSILIATLLSIFLVANFEFHSSLSNIRDVFGQPTKIIRLPSPISKSQNAQHLDPNASFIGWPLQRLCSETTWTPGFIFTCDNNSGGIGNIRNYILTCIRYAISAGATGLLLPKIRARSNVTLEISRTSSDFQPFNYFFDEDHFRTNLREYCPQIALYDNIEDIPNRGKAVSVENFSPKRLGDREGCDRRDLNRHTAFFRSILDTWLITSINPPTHTPNTTNPIIISLVWGTFFEWPVYTDGAEFVATFGSLLKFRKDVIYLADEILKALLKLIGNGKRMRWMGAHLRTEDDALKWWPDYTQQSTSYLSTATERNYTHIYLASGSTSQTTNFRELATKHNITTITKNSLLHTYSPSSLVYLNTLTWDQQALVDYLVLLQSEYFMGCSMSSFSMNIAVKRHLLTDGLWTRPWRDPGDGWSGLAGGFERYWDEWLFIREAMWP